MEVLYLRQSQWIEIQEHLDRCLPFEGCGLLGGQGQEVHAVRPIMNRLDSPNRYWMEPRDLVEAFYEFEAHGLDLVGIYHSHPDGSNTPSLLDREQAQYPGVPHLICSRFGGIWHVGAFMLESSQKDVPVTIRWLAERS